MSSAPDQRIARVREALANAGADWLLIPASADFAWLTGGHARATERLVLFALPRAGARDLPPRRSGPGAAARVQGRGGARAPRDRRTPRRPGDGGDGGDAAPRAHRAPSVALHLRPVRIAGRPRSLGDRGRRSQRG